MLDLLIREAGAGDVEALAGLMSELGYPSSPESMRERFARISEHPAYHTLVAEDAGLVIGMAGLETGHYYEVDGGYARISAFVVAARYRRLGVGTALIQAAEHRARREGADDIFLNSGKHRSHAHSFYEDSGYEITGYRLSKPLQGTNR
jgi:GNAT superfamily N-acetyltransferase